jgi:hypothetical protein
MQKSINGLSPGSTYIVQVASIDGQGQSDWSPTLEITIPVPELTPNAPTNVTATGNPDNIKISWTQATQNTDGGTLAQPAYYEVYRGLTSNPTELVGKTSSSSFTYQTVLYKINQTFAVKTVDGFGNRSATSNTASSTALSPAVMNGLIEKLDSYSRPTGSTVATFNTVRSHNLQSGNYVFIYGTTGGTGNLDTPSTTGATAGVPITYISDTSFSCSPNTSTAFSNVTSGAPGDMYPTEDALRIRNDGITIGNMRTKHIVGIAPTSFNMQSADTGTRMAIASEGISMFRATGNTEEQTVSLVSATGDATIVGKFSTGFSPNARVELDSGDAVPESIKFYSGLVYESTAGKVSADIGDQYISLLPTVASTSNGQKTGLQISSYSRSSPSNIVTFNTTLSHQLKVGESVTVTGTIGCDTLTPAIILTTPSGTQFTCIPNTSTSSVSSTGGYARSSRIYVTDTSGFGSSGYVSIDRDYYYTSKGSSDTPLVRSISGSGAAGITGSLPGTRTANTTVAHGFSAGDRVAITSVTPPALNEIVVVLTTTATSFTYTSSATGTRTGTTGSITLYPSFKNVINLSAFSGDGGTLATGDGLSDIYKFGRLVMRSPSLDTSAITGFVYGDPSITLSSVGLNSKSTIYNSSINMDSSSYNFFITNSGTAFTQNLIQFRSDGLSVNYVENSGDTTSGSRLGISGANLFNRDNEAPVFIHRFNTSGTTRIVQFLQNGANSGTINLAPAGTPAFAAPSDYRLKTNLNPVTDALERMKNAKVYTYNRIDDPGQNLFIGFLAHEVSSITSEATIGEKDAVDENGEPVYQMLQDAKLIPIMAQAIHDLIDKVETLENQINQQNI